MVINELSPLRWQQQFQCRALPCAGAGPNPGYSEDNNAALCPSFPLGREEVSDRKPLKV